MKTLNIINVKRIKIKMFLILILSSFVILLNSCEKEEFFFEETKNHFEDTKLEKSVAINKNDWKGQLDYLVDNDIPFLKDNGIKLLGYKTVHNINSKRKRDVSKLEILQEDSYVPLYTGEVNKIILTRIRDIPVKYKNQFTPDNLRDYLSNNKIDYLDLKKVVLNWQYKGDKISTTCLVSDKGGIIYDNIITNIIIVKMKSEVISNPVRLKKSIIRLKSGNIEEDEEDLPTPDRPISYSVTHYATGYWVWGNERGRAEIVIEVRGQVIGGIKHITSYSGYGTCNMPQGSCVSQVFLNSLVRGSSGKCDVAWAWSLSTTLVSIDFTLSVGGSYTATAGSTLGSQGHGSGREIVSPSDLN